MLCFLSVTQVPYDCETALLAECEWCATGSTAMSASTKGRGKGKYTNPLRGAERGAAASAAASTASADVSAGHGTVSASWWAQGEGDAEGSEGADKASEGRFPGGNQSAQGPRSVMGLSVLDESDQGSVTGALPQLSEGAGVAGEGEGAPGDASPTSQLLSDYITAAAAAAGQSNVRSVDEVLGSADDDEEAARVERQLWVLEQQQAAEREAVYGHLEGADAEAALLLPANSYEVMDSEELQGLEVITSSSSSEEAFSAETLPLMRMGRDKGDAGEEGMSRNYSMGVSELSLDTVMTDDAGTVGSFGVVGGSEGVGVASAAAVAAAAAATAAVAATSDEEAVPSAAAAVAESSVSSGVSATVAVEVESPPSSPSAAVLGGEAGEVEEFQSPAGSVGSPASSAVADTSSGDSFDEVVSGDEEVVMGGGFAAEGDAHHQQHGVQGLPGAGASTTGHAQQADLGPPVSFRREVEVGGMEREEHVLQNGAFEVGSDEPEVVQFKPQQEQHQQQQQRRLQQQLEEEEREIGVLSQQQKQQLQEQRKAEIAAQRQQQQLVSEIKAELQQRDGETVAAAAGSTAASFAPAKGLVRQQKKQDSEIEPLSEEQEEGAVSHNKQQQEKEEVVVDSAEETDEGEGSSDGLPLYRSRVLFEDPGALSLADEVLAAAMQLLKQKDDAKAIRKKEQQTEEEEYLTGAGLGFEGGPRDRKPGGYGEGKGAAAGFGKGGVGFGSTSGAAAGFGEAAPGFGSSNAAAAGFGEGVAGGFDVSIEDIQQQRALDDAIAMSSSAFADASGKPLTISSSYKSSSGLSDMSSPRRLAHMDTVPLHGLSQMDLTEFLHEVEEGEEGGLGAEAALEGRAEGGNKKQQQGVAGVTRGSLEIDVDEEEGSVAGPLTPDQPSSESDGVIAVSSESVSSQPEDLEIQQEVLLSTEPYVPQRLQQLAGVNEDEGSSDKQASVEEDVQMTLEPFVPPPTGKGGQGFEKSKQQQQVEGPLSPEMRIPPRALQLPPRAVVKGASGGGAAATAAAAAAASAAMASGGVSRASSTGSLGGRWEGPAAEGLVLAAKAAMVPHVNKVRALKWGAEMVAAGAAVKGGARDGMIVHD